MRNLDNPFFPGKSLKRTYDDALASDAAGQLRPDGYQDPSRSANAQDSSGVLSPMLKKLKLERYFYYFF